MITATALLVLLTLVGGGWVEQGRRTQQADEPRRAALPVSSRAPAALIIGDSYTAGTGARSSRRGYACLTAQTMGWRCNLDAEGGTGFVTDGTANSVHNSKFITRLQRDRRLYYADIVIVDGGRNDGGRPIADVVTAADACLRQVRRLWPHAPIVVIAPFYIWSSPGSYVFGAGLVDQLRPVISSIGGAIVDPVGESWVSARQARALVAPDGIHPNEAGHRYLATRLSEALIGDGYLSLKPTDIRDAAR